MGILRTRIVSCFSPTFASSDPRVADADLTGAFQSAASLPRQAIQTLMFAYYLREVAWCPPRIPPFAGDASYILILARRAVCRL